MLSPFSMSSANLSSADVGSDPGESTNSSGVTALDSLYDPGRSNGGGSMNRRPMVPSTKSLTAGITLSGRRQRITSSSWNRGEPGRVRPWKRFLVRLRRVVHHAPSREILSDVVRKTGERGAHGREAGDFVPHLRRAPLLTLGSRRALGRDADAAGEEEGELVRRERSSLPMMRQSRRKEKSSLSFSKSDRHTFW